ncbi:MAG: N-acetylmuramoyl-L-alanine amidase [Bacteroidales bacterium]|nr:N-acetylmuramoyl-L-alanine amidase [Bacteroidales bacterium]MCF8326779.1 N-acetylmuramoyl-L-alanine amidase [Bacteroidales bacterium]
MRKFGIILLLILFPVFSLMAQGYIDVVVIDAGHGGKDPGAVGSKYKEKDITLSIALKLGNYIEENLNDVKVIYTRKSDKFIPLHKRSEIANKNNADLFISIHCNATSSSRPYGSETFVMGPHKNDDNLEVAKQENASVLLEDNYESQYEGFDPNSPEAHIIFSLYQNTYLNQSLKIADRVQTQFRERVSRRDRGVKQAGFLVLWRAAMPSILVEAGFLSNPREQEFLGSEKGQVYIASAIFRAFRNYKMEMEGDSNQQKDTVKKTKEDIVAKEKKEDKEKEIAEEDAINDDKDDLFFAVQFATSTEKKSVSSFDNIDNVKRYYQNGMYKYFTGHERSLNTAVSLQHKIQKLGYDDAFVIAFYNGERISVSKASKRLAEE